MGIAKTNLGIRNIKRKQFVQQFHIINEADDELAELREGRTESELQFMDDISKAISEFMTREQQ